MKDKFTICVLLYGDYPELADRCLRSIAETIKTADLNLRIGMNNVSARVRDWVRSWVDDDCIWEYDQNMHKYPMMRQLFYGVNPIKTDYVMWFDDDSFLSGHKIADGPATSWLQSIEHAMANSDMLGSIYTQSWKGDQRDWVKAQAWYNGKDPTQRKSARFATGGWWAIRTEILRRFDYPFTALDHRGGDVMLGELCYQHGLRLNHFHTGVHINADAAGVESKAPRRGFDQPAIGERFTPGVSAAIHRATDKPPAALLLAPPHRAIIEL